MTATHRSEFPARNKLYMGSSPGDKGRGRRRVPGQHSTVFLPGHPVPESGIYEVIHDKNHRQAHEAVMYRNDPFPTCDQCDMRVRFKLVRSAPYIFEDEDFAGE